MRKSVRCVCEIIIIFFIAGLFLHLGSRTGKIFFPDPPSTPIEVHHSWEDR